MTDTDRVLVAVAALSNDELYAVAQPLVEIRQVLDKTLESVIFLSNWSEEDARSVGALHHDGKTIVENPRALEFFDAMIDLLMQGMSQRIDA